MKVFIVTEGSRKIGFGHITRCLSLYQAFEEKRIKPKLIINADDNIEDFINCKNYEIFNWLDEKSKFFELLKKADITIIDSYLAEISLYENLSNIVKIPVYMDDYKRLDYPKGIVVNASINTEKLDYSKKNEVKFLLGTKYIPLRKEFWTVPSKKINEKIKSVMITFGGDDAKNMTPKILKSLRKNYPSIKKNIVIGRSFQNISKIRRETDENTNLIYYPDAEKMKEYMLESDIAVSSGGQTIYEFARIGVPTIAIAVADNQLHNIKGWEKVGFLEHSHWYKENKLMEKLQKSINNLKNITIRKSKSDIGKKLVDGMGSLRVVKILLSKWYRNKLTLRKTTFEDALDIFNLSNDDIVRKNSFYPAKIEWEQHLKWLKEKLEDKNCVFLVVIDNLNKFYGQVRFDINSVNKEATINISLEKTIRGLGLSSFIIDKSVNELLKIKKVRSIKAYIKEENISSLKSFKKANFRFFENLIFKGNKSKVYVKEVE